MVCDREVVEATLAKYNAELYERFVDRVEAHKPVLAPDQIYLTDKEFTAGTERFPRLEIEELAVEKHASPPIFLSCQSTRRYHGSIRDLIVDLEKFRNAGEKVLFLFSNLGRAERVNDILKEYDIPSHLCLSEESDCGHRTFDPPGGGLPPFRASTCPPRVCGYFPASTSSTNPKSPPRHAD